MANQTVTLNVSDEMKLDDGGFMTKDAQKLLKHIIDETKSQNSTTVKIDISKIKNIPNIEFAA